MPRSDTAARVVPAPRKEVYAALVDPAALTRWLPPAGMTAMFERFDLRPGGSYRMVLSYIDASVPRGKSTPDTDIVDVRFTDVVPGVRLVQEVDFISDDPAFSGTMTMTWQLSEVDGGTRVEIRADNVPDGVSEEDHAAGMESSLVNLAAYLKE